MKAKRSLTTGQNWLSLLGTGTQISMADYKTSVQESLVGTGFALTKSYCVFQGSSSFNDSFKYSLPENRRQCLEK